MAHRRSDVARLTSFQIEKSRLGGRWRSIGKRIRDQASKLDINRMTRLLK